LDILLIKSWSFVYLVSAIKQLLQPAERSPGALIVTLTPKRVLVILPLATPVAPPREYIRKPSVKVLEA